MGPTSRCSSSTETAAAASASERIADPRRTSTAVSTRVQDRRPAGPRPGGRVPHGRHHRSNRRTSRSPRAARRPGRVLRSRARVTRRHVPGGGAADPRRWTHLPVGDRLVRHGLVLPGFDERAVLEAIQRYRITTLTVTGSGRPSTRSGPSSKAASGRPSRHVHHPPPVGGPPRRRPAPDERLPAALMPRRVTVDVVPVAFRAPCPTSGGRGVPRPGGAAPVRTARRAACSSSTSSAGARVDVAPAARSAASRWALSPRSPSSKPQRPHERLPPLWSSRQAGRRLLQFGLQRLR